MVIEESVFRAYDIRGIYGSEIDSGFAKSLGRSYASLIGSGKRIVLGRDVRSSSAELERPLLDGLLEGGDSVLMIGTTPTPIMLFAVSHYKLDGGIAVSASHNPVEWCGFKLVGKGAESLSGRKGLPELKKLMEDGRWGASKRGASEDWRDRVLSDYKKFVLSKIGIGPRRLKVGVDPGNGAWSGLAVPMLLELGIDVVAISDVADGRFPDRSPRPTDETLTGLKRLVVHRGLDIGIAFDGDGDRAVFVDENGKVIEPDMALSIMISSFLQKGESVVYEVSCSNAVGDVVKQKGGVPVLSEVGVTYIRDGMIREKAFIGGEVSGHMYFRDIYGIDDAFFAALKMLELLSKSGKRLSGLVAELPQYRKGSKEFKVDDVRKFEVIERLKKNLAGKGYELVTIDGVKGVGKEGWFLIRASNTTPMIRITAEAKEDRELNRLIGFAEKELKLAESQ